MLLTHVQKHDLRRNRINQPQELLTGERSAAHHEMMHQTEARHDVELGCATTDESHAVRTRNLFGPQSVRTRPDGSGDRIALDAGRLQPELFEFCYKPSVVGGEVDVASRGRRH